MRLFWWGIEFMLRKLIIILIVIFPRFLSAQTIDETTEKFWSAVGSKNNPQIVANGTILIDWIKKNNFELDSTVTEIRLYTALSYSKIGDFKKSLQLNLLTKELIQNKWGKPNRYYIICINNIASNYTNLANYSDAIKYNLEALNYFKIYSGKYHADYASSLNNLSVNFTYLGDYEKSLEYNLEALEIRGRTLGKENISYAQSLNNIAMNYNLIGDYSKSIEFNSEALKIYEKVVGKVNSDYATCLSNLALNYKIVGDYSKSLNYNLDALNIKRKTIGIMHTSYAQSLNNIAGVYTSKGELSKALDYSFEALKINQEILGKNHPENANNLNNIAVMYRLLGDYSKSIEYNYKALKIREKKFGKVHPEYVQSLNNISVDYCFLGKNSKALKIVLDVQEIYEKEIGTDVPSYIDCLSNISLIYSNMGDFVSSSSYLKKYYVHEEILFNKNKFGLNPIQLESYKKNLEFSFFLNASMLKVHSNDIGFIYKSWINLNGMLSFNNKFIENQLIINDNKLLTESFEELKLLKKQRLKNLEFTLEEKNETDVAQKALEEKINAIELSLSHEFEAYAQFNRNLYTSNISSVLKENELFIDIVNIPLNNFYSNHWTDSTFYIVFILNSEDSLLDYVMIEDGFKIDDEMFGQYKLEVANSENKTDLKSEMFYNTFWKPIADKIGSAKTIYVSLGGVYNKINLNTIYNPTTGKYLLEEKDIRIVNSARDFVLSKEGKNKVNTTNSASLFGFPSFDGNASVSSDSLDLFASNRDLSSFWLDSLTRGGMKAKSLPETKKEVENISLTLKSNGWQVNTFLADKASETNIKKQHSPRILHIATHGYFFQDIPMEDGNDRFLGVEKEKVIQDPMLRSGLLLSGANKTLKGEVLMGENGLLSAAEASLLDLRETELVVLSACETGKGEVKNSEGVYGLRKAFTDAGAQNLIMSLWKVDDKVTQEFMSRFYEIWLNEKTAIRQAFNRTQLEIKTKYPEPYYWGAFILVGE